jgi:hypothetical protein
MNRRCASVLFAAIPLLVAPAAIRPAAHSQANAFADDMGRGEVVGQVIHQIGKVHRTMQVRANGQTWTLNVPKDTPVTGDHNYPRSIHDVHKWMYVRAVGTRIDPLRLRTDRVFIIGDRLAMAQKGYPLHGYYASYAGYRSRYSSRHHRY